MADIKVGHVGDEKESAESIIVDIQKKVTAAFDVFDHEANKTVDVREIGTIIRSLGCCPSEGELHDLLAELEEEESSGYVRLEKFLPLMTQVMLEKRYRPASEEKLLKAFQTLDTTAKGFLTQEELSKSMMEEGEPFTQEEMDEMLSAAINPDKGHIVYTDFVVHMVLEEAS